jgi:hypothetical protein
VHLMDPSGITRCTPEGIGHEPLASGRLITRHRMWGSFRAGRYRPLGVAKGSQIDALSAKLS